MISLTATPYTFGFGLTFHAAMPVVSEITERTGKLWGIGLLIGPLYLQVSYVFV